MEEDDYNQLVNKRREREDFVVDDGTFWVLDCWLVFQPRFPPKRFPAALR